MITLHTSWLCHEKNAELNGLFLWAESPNNAITNIYSLLEKINYSSKLDPFNLKFSSSIDKKKYNSSPNFLSSGNLKSLVNQFNQDLATSDITSLKLSVQLPCILDIPVPSEYFKNNHISKNDNLGKEGEKDQESIRLQTYDEILNHLLSIGYEVQLQNYSVPGLKFNFFDAVPLLEALLNLDSSELKACGITLAEDTVYWVQVYSFVKTLMLNNSIHPKFIPLTGQWYDYNDTRKNNYIGWWDYTISKSDNLLYQHYTKVLPFSAKLFGEYVFRPQNTLSSDDLKNSQDPFCVSNAYVIDHFIKFMINILVRISAVDDYHDHDHDHDKWSKYIPYLIPEYEQFRGKIWKSFFTSNPILNLKGEDLDRLVYYFNKVSTNQHTFFADNDSWNVVLRLDPPDNESIDDWGLSFLFSHKLDETLLLPVDYIFRELVMKEGDDKVFYNNFLFHDPINFFYEKFHQFSNVFPFLDKMIRRQNPLDYQLSRDELFLLLSSKSKDLKDIGGIVLLPKNFENRLIPKDALSFNIDFSFGESNILDYNLSLIIGNSNERITVDQILQMADQKTEFVEIAGKWVNFNIDEAIRIRNLVKKQLEGISILDAIRLEAGDLKHLLDESVSSKLNIHFNSNFRRKFEPDKIQKSIPNFKATLRPYQEVGVSWLLELSSWQLSACLADDMGLGKTIQILAFLQTLKNQKRKEKKKLKPVIVVVPTSILGNWIEEFKKNTPSLNFLVHHGSNRSRLIKQLRPVLKRHDVLLTTYGTLYHDFNLLKRVNWQIIVIDEAQTIKNSTSKIFNCLTQMNSKMRIALTGTPIENSLSELWSIFHFILPNYLGTLESFTENFSEPIMNNCDEDKMSLLKRLTKPFILRRSKMDRSIIQDLPTKVETLQYCPMTKEQITLYEATMQSCLKKLEFASSTEKCGIILSTITKLKQICNHPSNFLSIKETSIKQSGKMLHLIDIVGSILEKDEKVLIFTQYRQMGELLFTSLMERFPTEVLFINGQVSLKQRQQMIDSFNQYTDRFPIMILTIQAGGTGLNLTAANNVIHYDRWWNPSVENQATDRVYRIGQSKKVSVFKFMTKGTIEARIHEIIKNKTQLVENYVSGLSKQFTKFSQNQLYELMQLQDVEKI